MSKYLTVKKASEWAGVSPCTVRHWIQRGLLSKRTFNGYNVAIDREELEQLAKKKEKA